MFTFCLNRAWQFIKDLEHVPKMAGLIAWLDWTKYGTLSNNDLNDYIELMALIMKRKPLKSCGIVICPYMVSEKTGTGGLRGEIRTGSATIFACDETIMNHR